MIRVINARIPLALSTGSLSYSGPSADCDVRGKEVALRRRVHTLIGHVPVHAAARLQYCKYNASTALGLLSRRAT